MWTVKKFDVNKELKKVENTLGDVGVLLSKPFHDRAKELIIELSKFKGVKINHFIMGMGSWVLNGTIPYKEIWNGQIEEGEHEIDLGNFETGRNCWLKHYENVNPGISVIGHELNEICDVLTHNPYLQIFDINAKEMKKLLATKKNSDKK